MNLLKKLAVVAIAATVSFSAFAQRGFDYYQVPAIANLGVQNFTITTGGGGAAGGGAITNGPYDMRSFDGVVLINAFAFTNTGTTGGTLSLTLLGSNDQTNLVPITNFGYVTNTTAIGYTNRYYGGTNVSAFNNYLLPGTIVTPNAAQAGWVTPYVNWGAGKTGFTNGAAIILTPAGMGGETAIGLNIADQPSYIYLVWTPGGAVTNFTSGANIVGGRHYASYPF